MDKCCRNCTYFGIEEGKGFCSKFDVYLEQEMIDQKDLCDDFDSSTVSR